MSRDVPRRLPPNDQERLTAVVKQSAPGSGRGQSRTYKPPRSSSSGQGSAAIRGAADLPRVAGVSGFGSSSYGDMTTPDGRYYLPSLPDGADWGFDEDNGQGVIEFGDDGGIYFYQPGIYATTLILNVEGIQAAAGDCSIRLFVDTSDPFVSGFSVVTRGGDARVSHSDLTSTSRTYYDLGRGRSGGMYPGFMYHNLDTVNVTNIGALIHVQAISLD